MDMVRIFSAGARFVANCAVTLVLGLGSTTYAAATGFEPPPIADQAGTEHHVGKVIWAELVTPKLNEAEHFYAGLFGWTFKEQAPADSHYAVALLNGEPVAGMIHHPLREGEKRQPYWLTFIAVQDVDAVERIAVSNGGKIVVAPRTYSLRGRQAVLTDPQGAPFAIIASLSGDPPDYLAENGAWIWSSLLTRDPEAGVTFYQNVFGYEAFDLQSADGRQHVVLSSEDMARASVNAMPLDAAHRQPHWLNFIRVADATETATKAVALGGKVLVAPRVDRHGGKFAVIADPAGAPFGVMEWNDADSKEQSK
jgi:predicted enzyme related to lactoylglutathione lyase